jgi:hypothetical protein
LALRSKGRDVCFMGEIFSDRAYCCHTDSGVMQSFLKANQLCFPAG